MNDELFERILVPIADPEDAEATARALRPHLDAGTTLIVTHVTQGTGAETTIETGRDQFAGATYETFSDILYRRDLEFEWVTLAAREVAEALVDAIEMTEATLVTFTPRDIDAWKRTLAGDPGSRLIREADVPVMVFPNQQR
ncbi:universal stress protein [Halorubrum sp. RMP-47]|uniref:Universal stress protein n=1 Tax=Halorubrum miltondacostae TaxID=3076378 RepID=A0ABD5M151_9EURY